MIKTCQIEERLAVAIREYARLYGKIDRLERYGAEDDELSEARRAAAVQKKIVRGMESTFCKLGGSFESMSRRLHLAFFGQEKPKTEPETPPVDPSAEMTAAPESDTVTG